MARTPAAARISSIAGVPCGCGPSSKVIATLPESPSRRGMRSAPATGRAIGASAGTAHATPAMAAAAGMLRTRAILP